MLQSNYYKVGGSLRYGHPTYIIRSADKKLYKALKQKEFCYVLNSRQMGKSSLRVRTMKTLAKEGFKCAAIDLGILGRFTNSSQWYGGLVSELWRKLRLTTGFDDDLSWWRNREELAPVHRFSQFIEDILLTNSTADIVIFLDEVDNIISLDFRDEFLGVIRNYYEKRAEYPEYNRLTFCLLGVATPSTLRIDKQTTPFNIGCAIQLPGFTLAEAQPLIPGLKEKVSKPEVVLAEILRWTKGQPFLTQKLCYLVVRYGENEHPNIQQIVQECLIDNWELQDEPEHLKTIRDRLLYNQNNKARLLGIYQQILQQQGINADSSDEQIELRLSGLVVKQYGKLIVANPIYQQVFNNLWVEKQLAAISPYQVAIAIWLKSYDTSRLLRGQALEEGQTWARKHSISAEERKFLLASEQLAKKDRKQAELAQRTQIVEKKLVQERKIARWQRLFFLSLILLITGMWGITAIYSRKANLSELKTLIQSSQALYTSDQKLDALIVALKAKKQLQRLIKVDKNLEKEVDRTLQQVVYEVKEYNRLLGHSDRIYSVAISPNGNLIASAGTDRTVRLWSKINTGWQQTQVLDDHDGWVVDVAISSDGNAIASASRDRTVKLWDKNGKLLATLTGHEQPVNAVAISSYQDISSYIIVSGSDDGVIKLWQPGKPTKTLLGHTDTIQAIAISQDGNLIISGSEDKTIKIWHQDGKLIKTITGHTEGVRAVALSPDQTKIVSGSRDKTVKIWDINGKEIATLTGHIAPVYGVDIHPKNKQIVSASADNTIKIWNLTGKNLVTLRGHTNRVWDVAYSPDGNWIASASWDKTVRLWQPNNNLVKTFTGHQDVAIALDYSSQLIASASDDKTVKLWQHDGTLISSFSGHKAEVYDVAIHPHEKIIVSAGADKTIQIWHNDGTILQTFLGHTAPIWAVEITPDGSQIISGSNDKTIKIWDFKGNLLHTLTGHQKKVWDIAISPQGDHAVPAYADRLISSSEDNTLKIWDIQGNLLHTIKGHTDAVRTVAYSPDGSWIVSGSEDRTVKLWDLSGKYLATLKGHHAAVKGVTISPNSQWIASVDDSGKILLWQNLAQSWHLVHTLQGHTNSIWSVAFSPDGKVLATAGEDSNIISWNLEEILQLDPLTYGNNWVKNYLQNSTQ